MILPQSRFLDWLNPMVKIMLFLSFRHYLPFIASLDLTIWSFFWWTTKIKPIKSERFQCQEVTNVSSIHAFLNLQSVQHQFSGQMEQILFILEYLIKIKQFKILSWQKIKFLNSLKKLTFPMKKLIKCKSIQSILVSQIFIITYFSNNQLQFCRPSLKKSYWLRSLKGHWSVIWPMKRKLVFSGFSVIKVSLS